MILKGTAPIRNGYMGYVVENFLSPTSNMRADAQGTKGTQGTL